MIQIKYKIFDIGAFDPLLFFFPFWLIVKHLVTENLLQN
jgi:hypothetical protein